MKKSQEPSGDTSRPVALIDAILAADMPVTGEPGSRVSAAAQKIVLVALARNEGMPMPATAVSAMTGLSLRVVYGTLALLEEGGYIKQYASNVPNRARAFRVQKGTIEKVKGTA